MSIGNQNPGASARGAVNCPKCDKPLKRGSVADVRWRKGYVYRRRECGYCGHRVTTKEQIVQGKDDGR